MPHNSQTREAEAPDVLDAAEQRSGYAKNRSN